MNKSARFIIFFCYLFQSFTVVGQVKVVNEDDLDYKDHPEEAIEQEFRLTMDPALGYVPRERLQVVRDSILQQHLQRSNTAAPAAINGVERGPKNVGGRTRALMYDPNDATHKKIWAMQTSKRVFYHPLKT